THALVAREEVLRVAREQVAVVGQAICEGRSVVKHPLRCALALVNRRLEGPVLLPEREDFLLDRREARARRHAGVVAVLGVRHWWLRGGAARPVRAARGGVRCASTRVARGREPALPRYHL